LERNVLRNLQERAIKNLMDILILAELKKGRSMSGYDFIALIHKKFHILVSSGTVYSVLYALERNGLIEGAWNRRKRVYTLTNKGEQTITIILNAQEKIQNLIATIF